MCSCMCFLINCSYDGAVCKFAEFVDEFPEVIKEQINFSAVAENGLKQVLRSIDSNLKEEEKDSDINRLKNILGEVLNKAHKYQESCLRAAQRGSNRAEIKRIKQEIRHNQLQSLFQLIRGMHDILNECSQCFESFVSECQYARGEINSIRDKFEAAKEAAEKGNKDSKIAAGVGGGAIGLGVLVGIFCPPAGVAIATAGAATLTGGAIGIAVHEHKLDAADQALSKVASLSSDLERVKRQVSEIETTMQECEEYITSANKSGQRAANSQTVSAASRRRINLSLDHMCSEFEEMISNHL